MIATHEQLVNETAAFTAADFVAAAEEYLGVRYYPQARSKDGMDCGGLLLACGRDLGYTDLEVLGYATAPDGQSFEALLGSCLTEVDRDAATIGDIVACDYGDGIQHTAIVVATEPKLTVIHAKRPRGVVRQYLYGRDLRGWTKTYRLRHLV